MNARLTLCLLLAAGTAACSSPNPRPSSDVLDKDAPEWVYDASFDWDADEEPFTYYAKGRAPIHLNINLAEENARADALADVQSFLETTIERLHESWAAESGDLQNGQALSSMISDEMFTRQIISGSLSGARTIGTYFDEQSIYVWVRYNAEDSFLGGLQNNLANKLREQTRELTQADRERMRAELERVVAERNGR